MTDDRWFRIMTLVLVAVVGTGCTQSERLENNLGNFVYPNTDFTGRSFEILPADEVLGQVFSPSDPVPKLNESQTVYASWSDPANVNLRMRIMAYCESRYLERTGASEWLPSSYGPDEGLSEYFDDGEKCGLDAYRRAAKAICTGQVLLDLAETTTPKAVFFLMGSAGAFQYAFEPLDYARTSNAVLTGIVPPQRAHGSATLALEALTHFRDGALWAARAFDEAECGDDIDDYWFRGSSSNGSTGHSDARIHVTTALAVAVGEALDLAESALGVAGRSIEGRAQARLSETGDEAEATRLSWRAPYDSRLELVNHLLGVKPVLFEPIPLWLPRPETTDAGVPIPNSAELLEIPRAEVAKVLKGEYPAVLPPSTQETRQALSMMKALGVDVRVWVDGVVLDAPEVWLSNPSNRETYQAGLMARVRDALLRDESALREHCQRPVPEFLALLGTSGAGVAEAAQLIRQEMLAFGSHAVWDQSRGACDPLNTETCEPTSGTCESFGSDEQSWTDRRIAVHDPGAARGAYYFALAVARARNIPGLVLPAGVDAGSFVGNFTGLSEPPSWYPGSFTLEESVDGEGSELAGEQTGIPFAASAGRGYAGQGLIQTRDAVALILSRALRSSRSDLEQATGVLRTIYSKERRGIGMRLSVCAGSYTPTSVDGLVGLYGSESDLSDDYQFALVAGEGGLSCALDSNNLISDCDGDPCEDSMACAATGSLESAPQLEFPFARRWAMQAVPSGRYYIVRRVLNGSGEPQTGVPTNVLASFTLERGGWTKSGDEEPETNPDHCNWYPAGPEVFEEVSRILTPGRRPELPQNMCGGVSQDIQLPLEDSLTNSSINGETVESSFRYFLDLARQAADEADLLGQDLITNGLAMDIRAEEAIGELEERCGSAINITDLEPGPQVPCASGTCVSGACIGGFCYTGLETPNSEQNPGLEGCLGTDDTRVDVSLGTLPLCVFRWEGKGNICQLRPEEEGDEGVEIIGCPFQVLTDSECQTDSETMFAGLVICDPEDSNPTECYRAVTTLPLAIVEEEVAPPAPANCEELALYRQSIEGGQRTRRASRSGGVSGGANTLPQFELVGQPWYGPFGARRAIAGLGVKFASPEMFMDVSMETDEHTILAPECYSQFGAPICSIPLAQGSFSHWNGTPPTSFATFTLNGNSWLSTGTVATGPALGRYPFAPLLPPNDQLYNRLNCTTSASLYCQMAQCDSSDWMASSALVRDRLQRAYAQAASFAGLAVSDVAGRGVRTDDWGDATGLIRTVPIDWDDIDIEAYGTYLSTAPLPSWMSSSEEVIDVYDQLGIALGTTQRISTFARTVAAHGISDGLLSLVGDPYAGTSRRALMRCMDGPGLSTCYPFHPGFPAADLEAFSPYGDRTFALVDASTEEDDSTSEYVSASEALNSATAQWGRVKSILAGAATAERKTVLDALELICHAAVSGGGAPSARCGEATTALATPRGLGVLQSQLECVAQEFQNNAGWLVLQDVPSSLAREIGTRRGRSAGGSGGQHQVLVSRVAAHFEQINDTASQVGAVLKQASTKLEIVESKLRELEGELDRVAIEVDIAIVQASIEAVRAKILYNQAEYMRQMSDSGWWDLLGYSTLLNPGSLVGQAQRNDQTGFHADVLEANAIQLHSFALDLSALQGELGNAKADLIDERITQTLLTALLEYQSAMSSVDTKLAELNEAAASVYSVLAEIDQNRSAARRALGKASFLSRDDVGREYNVNRVMRSRMNTGKIRYDRARDNAITMAWIARRAIEQRIGVDLSQLHSNMTLVPPPATWADKICTMSGIDYGRIRGVGEQEIDNYADEYIGDYVTLLENFVESYRFDYPFQDGADVAILSMRDEVFANRTLCDAEGQNRLLWSIDPTKEALNSDEAGWYSVPASADSRSIGVTDASDLMGPFNTENGRRPNGDVNAYRIALGLPPGGGDGADGVSDAEWSQAFSGLAPGVYRVSWYERLPWSLTGMACTQPLSATTAPQLRVTVRTVPASTSPIIPSVGTFVAVADDEALLDGCNWRRVTVEFANLAQQDVVLGFGLVGAVDVGVSGDLSDDVLPSAVFAAPQVEGPATNGAPPSTFFPTDDDFRYPVRTCADSEGKHFASSLNWGYGCEGFCPEGINTSCVSNVRCFREATFNISLADIERGKLGDAGGFAVGNFNYRFNEVGINLVGTGLRDCASTDTPATCYSSAFIPYSIRHSPPYRIRNYEGEVVEGNLFPGNIEHAKGLMAERYITNPISGADRTLMTDYWRREFKGRPLEGTFRLRIWDSPGFDFSKLEDIQLILSYRYWTRAQ